MTTTLSGIAEELERLDKRALAVTVANIRQGRGSTPRCEPPGEYAIELAQEAVSDVLYAILQSLPTATLIRTADDRETLESIIAWGDDTFGPCSQGRAIERAGEEWREMIEEGADVPIEAADVIICLLRIPGILDAINRKMGINRKREWNVRPDGTGYHVKARQALGGTNA